MSRRISALVGLVVVGIVLGASACSNATGPAPVRADLTCDYSTNNTCHQ
ncbi:MAG TPA: hypothetical protein VFI79_17575 [Gemmatimonadales bacterium]|jgi:hypothetical protein|nr:hypothetical protein [Gemmatimonadales bacterium]